MPAPGALLAALALLLAGGASAAAMPGTDRSGPAPTDRTREPKPSTTPTTGTTATEPDGQATTPTTPTTATTPVDPEKPGRPADRPTTPEHAQDDKPKQEKLDGKAAPPALGRRVVVGEQRGAVLVRLPGTAADQALEHLEDVPVGSVIDTRRGAVVLHSAVDRSGTQQQAFFFGGRFEVRQGADGYVDVHLRGRPGTCPPRAGRARAARSGTRRRRPQRKLWGQDDHGRFRTHGRDAVATVRGTHWVVRERCDGTKVSVTWGAVDVLDKRTGRTVRVEGGRSHLVRRAR